MSRKKPKMEFRYYQLPFESPVLALLGEKWEKQYSKDGDHIHFHNYLEIGFCYTGTGYMTMGEEQYRFHDRMFTVIPANYPHNTSSDPDTVSRWEYLFIDVKSILQSITRSPAQAEKIENRINAGALLLKEEEYPDLAYLLLRIFDTMRNMEEYYLQEAKGLAAAFFIRAARLNSEEGEKTQEEENGKVTNMISRSLDYIANNYMHNIKAEDIAGHCHVSETHFRRVFTEHMHMTPLEYLNFVRIRTACEYLKTTDTAVAEIAHKCGFATNSTFNRNFKQIMGVTPIKWKQRPENYEQRLLDFNIHTEEGW